LSARRWMARAWRTRSSVEARASLIGIESWTTLCGSPSDWKTLKT
jgi:hypothetical protein